MPYREEKRMDAQDAKRLRQELAERVPKKSPEKDLYLASMAMYPFPADAGLMRKKENGFPVIHIGKFAGIRAELVFFPDAGAYAVSFRDGKETLFSYPFRDVEVGNTEMQRIFQATGEHATPKHVRDILAAYTLGRVRELRKGLASKIPRPGRNTRARYFRILGLCRRTYPGIDEEHAERISAGILSIAHGPSEDFIRDAVFNESPAVMPPLATLLRFRPDSEKNGYFLMGEIAKARASLTAMLAARNPRSLIPQWMGYDQIRELSKTCARVMKRQEPQEERL